MIARVVSPERAKNQHQRRLALKARNRPEATIARAIVVMLLMCLLVDRCVGFITETAPYQVRRSHKFSAASSSDIGGGISNAADQKEATGGGGGGSSSSSSSDDNASDSSDVPSTPCVRICRYNANFYDGQICIGCYRDAFEISSWESMSGQEKSWALLDAADRVPEGCDVIEGGDSEGDADGGSNCDFSAAISKDELLRQAKYWEKL